MKRATGVTKRPGSSVYQWGIKAPADLRNHYPTQWAYRRSLDTSDLREANAAASALQAQWLARFAEQRRELNPRTADNITPELIATLAMRIRASVLGMDDLLRDDARKAGTVLQIADAARRVVRQRFFADGPPAPKESMVALTALDPGWTRLSGLSPAQLAELAQMNMRHSAATGSALARRDLEAVKPLVNAEARSLGMQIDWQRDDARPLLLDCLKAWRQAQHDLTQRDAGEIVDTPTTPAVLRNTASTGDPRYLRDLLTPWKASRTRKPQTEQAAEKALTLYEQATGNPPFATLTRQQGVAFKAWLLAQGTASGTAADRLSYVKGFLNFAAKELELLPRNPWSGLSIEVTTESPRRPWSAEQLKLLVERPLFTAYTIPRAERAGKDAAYWLLVLGLFTGARVSELAQLRVGDVASVDGVPLLRITNEGAGQSVKSKAGVRDVPVHSELARLGFLEYTESIRAAGATSLWPALRTRDTKAGDFFSRWFAEVRKAKGEHELPDFHSFRHTVRSKLASAGVAEPMIDTLMGHEVKGSTGARTYTQRPPADLQRAIERLEYPGLTLPRVFTAPVWTPASTKKPSTK